MIKTTTIYATYDGKEYTTYQEARDHERLRLAPCRFCETLPVYEIGHDYVLIKCCNVRVQCISQQRTDESVTQSLEIADQTARDKWNTIMKV